ncbi:hypothetical protein M6B38_399935 [Iris pallida]|uniref:Uncharacterized protein n=1 Tax=Iris pallida TaxID=29817 RepID=A0AAX6FSX3_IRIPA|nr:hypothetical protein M6B38_399935 [Iris pallida]
MDAGASTWPREREKSTTPTRHRRSVWKRRPGGGGVRVLHARKMGRVVRPCQHRSSLRSAVPLRPAARDELGDWRHRKERSVWQRCLLGFCGGAPPGFARKGDRGFARFWRSTSQVGEVCESGLRQGGGVPGGSVGRGRESEQRLGLGSLI